MIEIKVLTWKMGFSRYLHQIEVLGGWFEIISDSYYFSSSDSFIYRNKVLKKQDLRVTGGMRFMGKRKEQLGNEDWARLCFGKTNNLELRKKIYGKEIRKIEIEVWVSRSSGRVDMIREKGGEDMIPGRFVLLKRDMKKRIKDPLPYIVFQDTVWNWEEKAKCYIFVVSEISLIQFRARLEEELI